MESERVLIKIVPQFFVHNFFRIIIRLKHTFLVKLLTYYQPDLLKIHEIFFGNVEKMLEETETEFYCDLS